MQRLLNVKADRTEFVKQVSSESFIGWHFYYIPWGCLTTLVHAPSILLCFNI